MTSDNELPIPQYVIVLPERRGNDSTKYLVVRTSEWVAVVLGEKEGFDFSAAHDTHATADMHRDRLNTGKETEPCPIPASTNSSETFMRSSVSLMKRTSTTSPAATATASPPRDTSASPSTTTSTAATASP